MPEMGGKQLAEALVARDAALRVPFISGYTDGDIGRRGELDPRTAFLQKPFTARGLLGRVREVLGADTVVAKPTLRSRRPPLEPTACPCAAK